MGIGGAAPSVTGDFIETVVNHLTPVSAVQQDWEAVTPYGMELHHGNEFVLDVFVPGVAALRPLAETPAGSSVVRLAEYTPEGLDRLDQHLSDPREGSPVYRNAKSTILDFEAENPAGRRVVVLAGQKFTINSYRTKLSEWLIRGLAQQGNPRLAKAGIEPGQDLEARLFHEGGIDFNPRQYQAMAAALSEIVDASGIRVKVRDRKSGEERDGIPSTQTFRAYLEGKVNHPEMGWWELLRVFGQVSPEIAEAYASKNREQFQKQEGFYWSIRAFETLRSFMRKRHFFINLRSAADSEGSGENWDHISASKILAQMSAGQVQPIDEFYDAVRLLGNKPVLNQKDLKKAQGSETPHGIYVHGKFSTVPQIAIKQPKELWVDLFSLFNLFNGLVVTYLGKSGQELYVDQFSGAISPAPTVLTQYAPRLNTLIKPFVSFDPIGENAKGNDHVPSTLENQVNQLTGDIKSGAVDRTLGLPHGTVLKLMDMVKKICDRVPAEISAYLFISNKISEVEAYINLSPFERIRMRDYHTRAQVMRSLGLPENINPRSGKKVLDTLKAARIRVMKRYEGKYGGTLNGFLGLLLPGKHPGTGMNGNHSSPMDKFYPTTDFYAQKLLPGYGLGQLAPMAHLALTENIVQPAAELAKAMPASAIRPPTYGHAGLSTRVTYYSNGHGNNNGRHRPQ